MRYALHELTNPQSYCGDYGAAPAYGVFLNRCIETGEPCSAKRF